jgi:hypothetical protein
MADLAAGATRGAAFFGDQLPDIEAPRLVPSVVMTTVSGRAETDVLLSGRLPRVAADDTSGDATARDPGLLPCLVERHEVLDASGDARMCRDSASTPDFRGCASMPLVTTRLGFGILAGSGARACAVAVRP